MLAKISAETMKAVGAKGADDFEASLSAFIAEANTAKTFMAENQTTLADLQASIKALEGKLVSEARIKEICGSAATESISAWAASEAGKKIIGGEASRIAMEALANVGTIPAKPAPVGNAGNDTPEQKAAALIAAGDFEGAWKMDGALRRDFFTAKSYAAFMRAQGRGAVKINEKKNNN